MSLRASTTLLSSDFSCTLLPSIAFTYVVVKFFAAAPGASRTYRRR
jgi:hypothetical protein